MISEVRPRQTLQVYLEHIPLLCNSSLEGRTWFEMISEVRPRQTPHLTYDSIID